MGVGGSGGCVCCVGGCNWLAGGAGRTLCVLQLVNKLDLHLMLLTPHAFLWPPLDTLTRIRCHACSCLNVKADSPLPNLLKRSCTSCLPVVGSLCAAEDASMQDGAVKQCMVAVSDDLSPGCRRELGRSLHMALFVWQPQGLLTAPCDADIHRLCLSRVKEMAAMPGAVLLCLSEVVSYTCWPGNSSLPVIVTDGRCSSAELGVSMPRLTHSRTMVCVGKLR